MSELLLTQTLNAIDRVNQEDPNQVSFDNKMVAKELIYGQQMTKCLNQHWPQSSEHLQIAVRAQHIKRWSIARSEYPINKSGYFAWRKALGKFHAEFTEQLMIESGFSKEDAAITGAIIRKEKLKSNPETQTLEDVACLVFLTYYFDEFAAKHSEEKIIRIVQKTWNKMSEKAQNIALTLELPPHLATIVNKALN